jgi:RND family efflux transporter MFP subunit
MGTSSGTRCRCGRDALRLAGVLLALLVACHRGGNGGEGEEAPSGPKKVKCARVVSKKISDVIELRGTMAPLPDRDAQIAPQVAGRIMRVLVREGDSVKVGQPVAQIDEAPLVDQAAEADATLAKARAERKNAETTLERVQRVFEHGIAARQELDDAQARAASAQAGEAEAAAVAQRAHRQLERATVRSPLAGVVLKLLRRTGELVDGTPATPVVEVGDPSQLELVTDAPAQDLVRMKRGDKAEVTISALPGRTFNGTVTAVAPAVDRTTGLGTVRISLDLSGGTPPPVGVYGIAHESSGQERDALVVPDAALRNAAGPDAEVVVCGKDKVAHMKRVQRGARLGDATEIRGEVSSGDLVAVDPVLGIADGDALEVSP